MVLCMKCVQLSFFFNDTATTEIYTYRHTLSLHDALPISLFRMLSATWRGTLGQKQLAGVHFQQGDEIRIEGDRSNVILDGEIFQAKNGMPIILTSTQDRKSTRLNSSH